MVAMPVTINKAGNAVALAIALMLRASGVGLNDMTGYTPIRTLRYLSVERQLNPITHNPASDSRRSSILPASKRKLAVM